MACLNKLVHSHESSCALFWFTGHLVDDTSLLSIYPSFLNVVMQICYDYNLKWQ